MENLILIKPCIEYNDEIISYKNEFLNTEDRMNGCGGLEKYDNPEDWIDKCVLYEKPETLPDTGKVSGDQYMLVRKEDEKILGMINFRHYLNGYLAEYGGHIGYSVRKTERRKGYAKKMLELCLDKCREKGLRKVLVTCMKKNTASRKTIMAMGGLYERTTHLAEEDVDMERYWISLYPLEDYYSRGKEDGRLVPKNGKVEFLTTMRYIERYLRPGAKILEIGAGTGRYSITLAEMGHSVDAVELMDYNIEIFKNKIGPEHKIKLNQGNVLDLDFVPDNAYDLTLLLGPMYHLYTFEDKRRALSETLRVTKPGGIIFAAYCIQDASIIQYGFLNWNMESIFGKNLLDPETFRVISNPAEIFELYRKEDINELMKEFITERLHYVATDLFTQYMRSTVNAMDDETYEMYLRYHFSICERPDMTGITNHILDVFRKIG